jgi:hypothetical protein
MGRRRCAADKRGNPAPLFDIVETTMSKELNWITVDVATFPKALTDKYTKLVAARKAAVEAREAFEQAFEALAREKGSLEKDDNLAFGYKFGRLAVAKAEAKKPKAPAKPVFKF